MYHHTVSANGSISMKVESFQLFAGSSQSPFVSFIGYQVFDDESVSVLPTQCFIDVAMIQGNMRADTVITFTEFTVMDASVHIKVLA